jgi:molecular chaperone GrpE
MQNKNDHGNMEDQDQSLGQENPVLEDGLGMDGLGSEDSDLNVSGDLNTNNLDNTEIAEQTNITELELKVAELKDLYVRSQAEIQNMQRRTQDELKKSRDYAIASFAKDLVVVKDYLEMALKDQSGNFEAIKTGVDLTLKQLIQVFERQLIKEINPTPKDKLDPHLHQAMNSVESDGQESNTVVSVMQKGYMLNDRVLRPAMVVVAK